MLTNRYLATGGSSVEQISDPNPIFQIAPLPTNPLRHIAYYNDIYQQIIITTNNIHNNLLLNFHQSSPIGMSW